MYLPVDERIYRSMDGGKMFCNDTESAKQINSCNAVKWRSRCQPVERLGEGQTRVSGPPEEEFGGQPGAPADVVDHQHYHQHLKQSDSRLQTKD